MNRSLELDSTAFANGIRELARLLNLWKEHGFTPIAKETLHVWCQESASRCRLPPRPDEAVGLLRQLTLIEEDVEGNLVLPHQVIDACTSEVRIDELSEPTALLVLERLLTVNVFRDSLEQVLASIPYSAHDLQFGWHEIRHSCRRENGWVWLQQLGMCENDGINVVLNPMLRPFIVQALPKGRPISQLELGERLLAQAEMADRAEDFVVALEKHRLRSLGKEDLADSVYRISLQDVAAGYDIVSFQVDGRMRRIEVKASAGPRTRFFISRNEFETAKKHNNSYFLAWLAFAGRLPLGEVEVSWFQNPAAIIDQGTGPWVKTVEQYCVERVSDDSGYMWCEQ